LNTKAINAIEEFLRGKLLLHHHDRQGFTQPRGPIRDFWRESLEEGHIPIQEPGPVTAAGADYITLDPDGAIVVVWDAKYRGPGQPVPTSIPATQLQSWIPEVVRAVQSMPDSAAKIGAVEALRSGKIKGRIFNYP
jgi:filamentous hemagglutinin